jgi:hypothetical protein
MFDELHVWWQNTSPEMQTAIQAGSVMLLALVSGHYLASIVARTLRAHNFDALLRLPGVSVPAPDADQGVTPTVIGGHLVRLTVWALGVWWVAFHFGQPEIAAKLAVIVSRTWALAGVLVAALALGGVLARRLIDCLQGAAKAAPEALPGSGAPLGQRGVAGAVGAVAYVFVVLLALLVTADLFDWPLTRNSAVALWQFAQHLLIAVAALLIGSLGARWARDLVTTEAAVSAEKRAAQYTAVGVMAATTVLAVAVLLSGAGVIIGLAALVVLGFLLWLVRGYLPDVAAGLQLRAHQVREVTFDGAAWQVAGVGFLTTQVGRAGEFYRVQNRLVLEARLHGASAAGGPG